MLKMCYDAVYRKNKVNLLLLYNLKFLSFSKESLLVNTTSTLVGALQVRSRWRQNNDSILWRSQLTGVRESGRMGK